MLRIIETSQKEAWDSCVKSFARYDVYYLRGYVEGFRLHGDGEPLLLEYRSASNRAICVLMRRDIADDAHFRGTIPRGRFHDLVTPYGYGGFLFDHAPDPDETATLTDELARTLNSMGAVSAFFRFHPVLGNALELPGLLETAMLGKTVAINLSTPETIWGGMTSKNRNMVRKAEKSGVEVRHGRGTELLEKFREIYNGTMDHDNASPYYYFGQGFYDSVGRDLADNHEIFYAEHDGTIIAMSIILFANGHMHYHLSGSRFEYRGMAPSNLLLYKAALWGCGQGFSTFHLGGGLGGGEDSLYKFKAAFNRHSDCRFAIGKAVIDHEAYDRLTGLRNFTPRQEAAISFFPKYRADIK